MRKIALFFCAFIGAIFLSACGGGGDDAPPSSPVSTTTACEGYWVGPADTVMSRHSFVLTPKNISSIGYGRISTFEPLTEGKLFIPKGNNFTLDQSLSCVNGVLNVKFEENNFVFAKSKKELWSCTAQDLLSGWYDTEEKKAYIHLKGFEYGNGYDVTTTSDGVQGVAGNNSTSFSCKNPNIGKGG